MLFKSPKRKNMNTKIIETGREGRVGMDEPRFLATTVNNAQARVRILLIQGRSGMKMMMMMMAIGMEMGKRNV